MFSKELNSIIDYYDMMIAYYDKELSDAPDGKLSYNKSENRIQLLHIINQNGRRIRKGINNNETMKRALARKELAKRSVEILRNNRNSVMKALGNHEGFNLKDVLASMPRAYSYLPEEYFYENNSRLLLEVDDRICRNIEWGNQDYPESMYHSEMKNKMTSNGTYVRSKSELLIYESLLNNGIPMHYDEEQIVNGIFIVPDFTFMDSRGDLFYWEYFGMMDDSVYAKRNLKKLSDYYDAGIIPGDNLITTFDKSDSINMAMIQAIINNEIIPRL